MTFMNEKWEKLSACLLLIILIISLLPVMYLGRYNHPTGDDYYYGESTRREWIESGNVWKVLQKAVQGVALEYERWQGTYSAMFFMYIPPNIWGDAVYRAVTAIMLLLLSCGVFVFLRAVFYSREGGSSVTWGAVSAIVVLLCVETVPSQGETFFWYNGSMYYTGFFSISLIFLGLLINQLRHRKNYRTVLLIFLTVLLAGGNYTSLLPLIILMVTIFLYMAVRKQKTQTIECAVLCVILLGSFAVSAFAPGNAVRQSGMWRIPAWKAIMKSLLQGVLYCFAWIDLWWLVAALCLAPFFWRHYSRTKFAFPFPLGAAVFSYGVFCSMSCPTFYTMNSTGPARSVAIVYYGFVIWTLFLYYYLLGAAWRHLERKGSVVSKLHSCAGWCFLAALLLAIVQIATGASDSCTTVKAVTLLANGEAKAYEEEYQQRMQILEDDSVQNVEFAPYVHQPDMLYVGDFVEDSEHPTNRAAARYFQKESIAVVY